MAILGRQFPSPTAQRRIRPRSALEYTQTRYYRVLNFTTPGFPGIPPQLPDRPPACIKGIVELRPPGSFLKARWVKVELRKVETLPGGGTANMYYDYVGESPVTLWQAAGEWDEVRARDFPFQIRIPEVIPPSIALERNAGIKYELVASVLTKGKRGLLRRESTPTLSTSCQIIIDKHELHSAWPIYARPESRSRVVEGYTLTVNRTHTAYGPGDRIAVQTLVKNDTTQTNQVRYYEFALKQRVEYKPGMHGGGRRQEPPQVTSITEQRIPITMASALHPGMQAKAELSLQVPHNHTTTTVLWAQRIEVAFFIHVKAVLAGGQQLVLALPITMSNWTRAQSLDVVRRIGTAPNLSGPGQQFAPSPPQPAPVQSWPPNGVPDTAQYPNGRPMSMAPSPPNGAAYPPTQQELGGAWNARPQTMSGPISGANQPPRSDTYSEFGAATSTASQLPATYAGRTPNGSTSPPIYGPSSQSAPAEEAPRPASLTAGRRPATAPAPPQHRFTVMNATVEADESSSASAPQYGGPPSQPQTSKYMSAEEEKRRLQEAMNRVDKDNVMAQPAQPQVNGRSHAASFSGSSSAPAPAPVPKAFMSAEEEKARLAQQNQMYESAISRVNRVQSQALAELNGGQASTSGDRSGPSSSSAGPPEPAYPNRAPQANWPTAEEEKFRQAQAAVLRSQGSTYGSASDSYASPLRSPQLNANVWAADGPSSQAGGSSQVMSPGKMLYQRAMAEMRPNAGLMASNPGYGPTYPTAADEKEIIRYHRAMEAAQTTQYQAVPPGNPAEAGPVPYEALFPNSGPPVAEIRPLDVRSRSPPNSSPPPGGPIQSPPLNALQEKELMRKRYEAQDAAARQGGATSASSAPLIPPAQPPAIDDRPLPSGPAKRPLTAVEEKALLKAQYAADDASAQASNGIQPPRDLPPPFSAAPPPLPRAPTFTSERSMPIPPSLPPTSRPLTAAEEKAQLQAKYAAEAAQINGEAPSGPPPIPYSAINGQQSPSYTSSAAPRSPPSEHGQPPSPALFRDPTISLGKQKAAPEQIPPPLPSKPPVEYWKTQEDHPATPLDETSARHSPVEFIDVPPISPFNFEYSYSPLGAGGPPPPPPLPPKPVM